MKKTLFVTAFLFASLLLKAQNFHDTQGKFDVSSAGQSTYTLPIAMPPSLKDTAPVINLVYTSGQFGGIAGQGWNISSISAISRIATRKSLDVVLDGVDYDSNDKLALDGQRLMLKTGAYWGDNSVYQTEVHSNNKIELKGTGASTYFIVTAPDGSRSWYGNYGGMNAVDPTTFYIVRYEDSDGNYITYHYTNPSGYSLCISEIKFSANTNGLSPLNSIVFNYKNAKRIESTYIKAIKHQKGVILDNIVVYTAQQLFRKYQLTHLVDPQLGYEKISKIQEFNGAAEAANPIEFEYDTTVTQTAGSEIQTTYSNNIDFNSISLSGDFDGDGRLDFVADNNLYTKLFQGTTGTVTPMPSYNYNRNFAISTLLNNKFNQQHSIVYISMISNFETGFKVVNFENGAFNEVYNKTIALDRTVTKSAITTNSGSTGTVMCLQYYNQNGMSTSYITNDGVGYSEGDFDGNGISEILISKSPKSYKAAIEAFYPSQPYTFNPNDCPLTITPTSDIEYYLLDMNPNEPTTLGSSGYLKLSTAHLVTTPDVNQRAYFQDFNGDGRTDILLVYGTGTYFNQYKLIEIHKTPNYAYTILLGQGTFPDYKMTKQVLFGDYNGDGKIDMMTPDTDGGSGHSTWHIYYCNPNPAGGSAFTKETHNIVEYWPTTGNYYDTQTHFSNYYAMDTNNDGKSDIVRVWRKYYKPSGTINDHNTKWSISTYANNIGNTQVIGNKFTLDYTSPCNDYGPFSVCDHTDDSPELPTPVVSNFRYAGLDNQMVMVRNHHSQLTYINFTKDVSKDILLKKITASSGSIIDEITYKKMEPTSANNGLGALSGFYSSSNSLEYPNVELKRAVSTSLVSSIKNTCGSTVKYEDFRYHGYTVNMDGLGNLGFRKMARSAWYQDSRVKRLWNVTETNPLWRGGVERTYTQLVTNGSLFTFQTGFAIPTGATTVTTNALSCFLDGNNIFRVHRDSETSQDVLTGVKSVRSYLNHLTYMYPVTITTAYYLDEVKQGEVVESFTYDNNPSGVGSLYYIGRPNGITKTITAYGDSYKTNELYTYTGTRLSKIRRRGNTLANNYLTEEFGYDSYGNINKKTLSYEGYTGTPVPRVTDYTYDPTGRFVKTFKDVEGLVTTYNSYHPLFGLLLSSTDPFSRTTTKLYDTWGKVTKETDHLNNSNTYTYVKSSGEYTTTKNGSDGSSSIEKNDALGRLKLSGAKNIDNTWSYVAAEYDAYGRKYRTSEPYNSGNPTQWNTILFDEYSRVKQQSNATGKITTIVYSGMTVTANDGVKQTSSTKDANGHVISATDGGGTINYTYYANGGVKVTNFEGHTVTMEYDEWARKKKLIDLSAGTYEYTYYPFGELRKEINPKGDINYLYYDSGKIKEKYCNESGYGWDLTYVYDPTTKMLSYTDWFDIYGEQHTINYTYDPLLRVTEEEEKSNYTTYKKNFTYDAFGRVQKESSYSEFAGQSSTVTVTNVYKNGHKWKIIDDTSGQTLWQANSVNARKQLMTAQLGNGITMSNSYDGYGYVSQIKYDKTTSPASNIITLNTVFIPERGNLESRGDNLFWWVESFQYDNLDRLTGYTNARGEQEVQSYDNKGRITQNNLGSYQYLDNNKIYQQSSMDLTPEGKAYFGIREGVYFNTMEDKKGMKILSVNGYYDSGNSYSGSYSIKLSEASAQFVEADTKIEISNAAATQYTYSAWVYSEGPGTSISLVLTSPGGSNIVSESTTLTGGWKYIEGFYSVPPDVTQLTFRVEKSSAGNVWFDDLKVVKTADSNQERKLKIAYNMFKSPVTIEETGVSKIDFDYDSNQYRAAMYYGSLSTNKLERPFRKYYSSGGGMEIKYNVAANSVEFVTYVGGDGYSAPVAFKKKGAVSEYLYLHRDYQGSIIVITNTSGNIVEKRLFDAWGNIIRVQDGAGNSQPGLTVLDRGYTGHEHLESVGLINMNGRLYDPKLHRFLQPDNFVQEPHNTQNYNSYSYVLNNPLKYKDANGEEFTILTAALIGAIISVTSYTITALVADVPFSTGGFIKSAFMGAASGAITFGIGEAAQSICQLGLRLTFQAFAHGLTQGSIAGIQGGDFWQSFSAGAVSSMASSVWAGGEFDSYDWKGIGGTWGSNTLGQITFGTVSGGAGAALTNGNFWTGAATGLTVTLLNHVAHKIEARKTILQRFMRNKKGYIVEPYGPATLSEVYIKGQLHQYVEGLEESYIAGGSPDFGVVDLRSPYAAEYFFGERKIWLYSKNVSTNYQLVRALFHEYRHAWQDVTGIFAKAVEHYGPLDNMYNSDVLTVTRAYLEVDAYNYQLKMGDQDSFYQGRRDYYGKFFNTHKPEEERGY